MRRTSLISLLVLILLQAALALVIYTSFNAEKTHRMTVNHRELKTSIETFKSSYQRLIMLAFQRDINLSTVKELMALANQSSNEERQKIRGRLYRLLHPTYKVLKTQDIRGLQFILPDGTSFLRFNRPDLYGDRVSAVRPTINQALITNQSVIAFENSVIYPGFHFAIPLFRDGLNLGIVDFSVAVEALYGMLDTRESSYYQAIINLELLQQVSHPSVATLYKPSPIHPDFLQEDPDSSLRLIERKIIEPVYWQDLEHALATNEAVQLLLTQGESFTVIECIDLFECYNLSFYAMRDSLNRSAGFIIKAVRDANYPIVIRNHIVAFLIGVIFLLIAWTAYRQWWKSKERLETVAKNMGEGLYVMDGQGVIQYSNTAANKLLQYPEGGLNGRNGLEIIQSQDPLKPVNSENCPIRTFALAGRIFHSSSEKFRTFNGEMIPVEITSSPLMIEGSIRGVVVIFRDISTEYDTRVRLQQTDAAFQQMAEAVVITDDHVNIVAVNRAFTEITGYEDKEVLGKNPRILASGKHDEPFYRAMWSDILNEGSWEGELWNRRKNGELYPEWSKISAITDETGKITNYVSVFSDISDKLEQEQKLQDLAYNDQLTQLPNRISFMRVFDHALLQAKRHEYKVALLYLDLDRFKQINDSLGHLVGDKLLQEVAGRIKRLVRANDFLARLGGDEFILMIEWFQEDDVPARVANKILQTLAQPISIEGRQLHATASIGISLYPRDGHNPTELLKNADTAMYRSKREGRNNYSYFTVALADEVKQHFRIENNLRNALKNDDELQVYYQPKLNLTSKALSGAEALIRWHHPTFGVTPPADFLPIAEETGLMTDITEYVLRRTARQIREWDRLGVNAGKISINLDYQSIRSRDINLYLKYILSDEGIDPERIELEIPETIILEQNKATTLLEDLKQSGFTLSIDDFGTGESSLYRLRHLPVETLKIDRAFVKDIAHNKDDLAVLISIISMAKSLGKRVICEGVETAKQYALVRQIGCDEIQGYFLAKPMPHAETTEFYRQYQPANLQVEEVSLVL